MGRRQISDADLAAIKNGQEDIDEWRRMDTRTHRSVDRLVER